MSKSTWLGVLACCALLASPFASAQVRPYIGFIYPAGGQTGTVFQIKLGGQSMDDVNRVFVSGTGVEARIVEYRRPLGPQEITLLSEQMRELKREMALAPMMESMNMSMSASAMPMTMSASPMMSSSASPATGSSSQMMSSSSQMSDTMMASGGGSGSSTNKVTAGMDATQKLIERIQNRIAEYVLRPASVAIAGIAFLEVKIAPDAEPGERELRIATTRGISNPIVFHVGQLPEARRKPMITSQFQVLGKEELALRKRPVNEVEDEITVPCTVNGQVASGEKNKYRFHARKGQRLVLTTYARQLIPYIADAVPGWFQPVLALYDANGKEVAYDDDYRFKPDPIITFEAPKDGDYTFVIYDGIYRGREDFVYRITIGELPFVTSIFPLGGRVGSPVSLKMKGWNLQDAKLSPPQDAAPGVYQVAAKKDGVVSNHVPFALDNLPECFEKEPNNTIARAQKVTMPIIINGRIDKPDDWDVFQITGKAGDSIVAEVYARRLDSPLDSVLKVTDAKGKLISFNDDNEDLTAGVNTHHADSYLMAKLPADGTYYVHIGDTARNGGEEYAYRLRISAPRPEFALRVVPSSIALRARNSTALSVYAVRKDGFNAPIKLGFKGAPQGFTAFPIMMTTQSMVRISFKTDLRETSDPANLTIEGRAKVDKAEIVHDAVPAEDRMQAFLWRHLVPAQDLKVMVFDPNAEPPVKRQRAVRSASNP